MAKRGRPRAEKYKDIRERLEKYIYENDIPIIAEFAYKNDYPRQYLYDLAEISDTIKKLIDKKEANLEKQH